MLEPLILVKLLHVISSAVLFSGVFGVAVIFTLAQRLEVGVRAQIAGLCRAAGFVTAAAFIVQPVTGFILIRLMEDSPMQPWLQAAYALFAVALLAFGLQVRWLGQFAKSAGWERFGLWSVLAWGTVAVLCVIFYLMLAQPALWGHAG